MLQDGIDGTGEMANGLAIGWAHWALHVVLADHSQLKVNECSASSASHRDAQLAPGCHRTFSCSFRGSMENAIHENAENVERQHA